MEIDNFDLLKPLMTLDDEHFYWCQVIKRRKENPNQSKNSIVLRHYYLTSDNSWDDKVNEIKELCRKTNARAYININRRNWKACSLMALEYQAKYIRNNDYKAGSNAFNKACGHQCSERRWIIDNDTPNQVITVPVNIIATIPTPNGYHLIVPPFNPKDMTGDADIHKDNPTIGYAFCDG